MVAPMVDERPIRQRWLGVREALDERGRRMRAAAEARSHGSGGMAVVVRATGISAETACRRIAEVRSGERPPDGRPRRPRAGRPGQAHHGTGIGLGTAVPAPAATTYTIRGEVRLGGSWGRRVGVGISLVPAGAGGLAPTLRVCKTAKHE
jgi:hypothetical protein